MRETDLRMTKYSRRGLLFNFGAYLFCLMGGRFVEENKELTVVLTSGLLLVTILRGYFLFRFDHLYPRAPMKWRNSYFVATLLGAFWWGVIMVSITLKLDMRDEAPLFWLYTVVFFSTTAHAFAPYHRFLAYYQFLGMFPAAVSAFFIGELHGYLYGSLLAVFYVVLTHQCRLIAENYWGRLEATYALARKTRMIDEEKRDTRASVKLNNEFLAYLCTDLAKVLEKSLLQDKANVDALRKGSSKTATSVALEKLCENVDDFKNALTKELQLDSRIFNVRHELQHVTSSYVDEAEEQGIHIETALSPNLPMRVKGDPRRFAQVINSLLALSLKDLNKGIILLEVEFLREFEAAGELIVSVSRLSGSKQKNFFSDDSKEFPDADLAFAVAKAIAELMDGGIEISEIPREGILYRFNAKLDIAEISGQLDFHKNSFSGRNVLLIHNNARIVDIKRQELDALGFSVLTETQYSRAQSTLLNSYRSGKPIESVLYYIEPGDNFAREFNHALSEHPELKNAHQLIAASRKQRNLLAEKGFVRSNNVHYVNKPTGLFELESSFFEVFGIENITIKRNGKIKPLEDSFEEEIPRAIIFTTEEGKSGKSEEEFSSLGLNVQFAIKKEKVIEVFSSHKPDIFLIDCNRVENVANIADMVRTYESEMGFETFIPIIGICSSRTALESTAYELGVDDFIDLSDENRNPSALVRYWATLH